MRASFSWYPTALVVKSALMTTKEFVGNKK